MIAQCERVVVGWPAGCFALGERHCLRDSGLSILALVVPDSVLEPGGSEGEWRIVIEQTQRNGVEMVAFTPAVADIGTKAG
jgi:hypothetical protein